MHFLIKRTLAATALIAVMLISVPFRDAHASSPADDLSATRRTLDALQNQIQRTKNAVVNIRRQESNALTAVQKVEEELESVRAKMETLESRLKRAQAQLLVVEREHAAAERELAEANRSLSANMGAVSARLVQIYKMGPASYLELLLSADSFLDFVTRFEFLGMIVRKDIEVLSELKEEKDAIAEKRKQLASRKAQLEQTRREIATLHSGLRNEEKTLASRMAEREFYLQRIQAERARWEKELAEEERQSRELEHIIRDMQARLGRSGNLNRWTGQFIWPTEGRASSEFGWRIHPIFRDRRFHSGIDIAAPTGTPVRAAADGYVLHSGWISGYGNTVILDHGGGLSTLYAHNNTLNAKAGRAVLQGDLIARVGSTGFSTGPHLHFEVRDSGTPVDPRRWLPKR